MGTFTTEDLPASTIRTGGESKHMARYVTTVTKADVLDEEVETYGGEVKSRQDQGDTVIAVTRFEDEEAGKKFSLRLNGTVFRDEWAAKYNADSRASGATS